MIEFSNRFIFAIFSLWFLFCLPECSSGSDRKPDGVNQVFHLKTEAGRQSDLLILVSQNELAQLTRILFLGPDNQSTILTRETDARSGTITFRADDDSSDWWIEVEYDYAASWPTIFVGLREIMAASVPGQEEYASIHQEVRGSSGLILETNSSIESGYPAEVLLARVEELKAKGGVSMRVPTPVGSAARIPLSLGSAKE